MLTFLKIQHLALVDQLVWEPSQGFTCITGETGAGKSVIMNALRLVLGERADKSLIRSGESTCKVEALFTLAQKSPIHELLEHKGFPPCEHGQLSIRRMFSASSGRQFINDSPATTNMLKELGEWLIDIHGPNDNRSLISREKQLALLDTYGDYQSVLEAYSYTWNQWNKAVHAYRELLLAEKASDLEIELLQHKILEIDEAGFTKEEIDNLEQQWQKSRNLTRLSEASYRMANILSGHECSLLAQFHEFVKSAHDLERLDSATKNWFHNLDFIDGEFQELDRQLNGYISSLSFDSAELEHLENRISLFESLKRKYGGSFESITESLLLAKERLNQIEHRSEHLDKLKIAAKQLEEQLLQIAAELTQARQNISPKLADNITHNLRDLGFRQALVQIKLSRKQELSPHGHEDVELLFCPNPGEPLMPLRQIASSGELARVMLAVKAALADKDTVPLLVFDEIDSNVGGEIAKAVGMKMRTLGSRHQVFSITHFPQVAGLAQHHFLVEKNVFNNRTTSSIREVVGQNRIDELVRMLGGGGTAARAHAETLLKI